MFRVGDLAQGPNFIVGNEVLVLFGGGWGIVGMTVPGWMDTRLGNWLMEGVGGFGWWDKVRLCSWICVCVRVGEGGHLASLCLWGGGGCSIAKTINDA